ncbi:hypothetical protein DH2020_014497 [Rehmannia glutinosa]|uniref:Retrotransposon Copia-like N-terminal domain-containing protein n=1 Tax=Rehmannia glutinosa TaxID=99300 RepID=A0ABR0WWK2_REHGL
MAMATTSSPLPSLTTLTLRLDRTNYNYWRVQVLTTVRAHGFEEFLFGTTPAPPQFLDGSSTGSLRSLNPTYSNWMRRDQLLMSWLLSSMAECMLGHVTRCSTAAEVWSVLETLFHTQSKARVNHLRSLLQSTKKGDLSVEDYILKMVGIADSLQAAGKHIPDDDLVSYILAGFGSEFESVVVNLQSRDETLTIPEVQFALQSHEMRLLQLQSSNGISTDMPSQAVFNTHTDGKRPGYSDSSSARGGGSFNRGGSPFRGRGRGRFNRFRPICQICGKQNHLASKCFKRFDTNFPGIGTSSPPMAHLSQQLANLNLGNSGFSMPSYGSATPQSVGSERRMRNDGFCGVDEFAGTDCEDAEAEVEKDDRNDSVWMCK